eukprot:15351295-Ditylum_brightwellii.AAC.1
MNCCKSISPPKQTGFTLGLDNINPDEQCLINTPGSNKHRMNTAYNVVPMIGDTKEQCWQQ